MTMDLAKKLVKEAAVKGLKVATAESCTAGLISGAITDVAGSSSVFDRGFVTYSNEAKMQMLGVSAQSLDKFGAVSEAVAKEMAYGAIVNSMADIAVAVTGIAGPDGGTEDKPVGLVWFGLAEQGQAPTAFSIEFGDIGRAEVRKETVFAALDALVSAI